MSNTTEQHALLALKVVSDYLAEADTKEAFRFFTGQVVGVTLARLEDSKWEDMRRESAIPCGGPRCDCHIYALALLDASDTVRDEALASKAAEEVIEEVFATEDDEPEAPLEYPAGSGLANPVCEALERGKPDEIKAVLYAAERTLSETLMEILSSLGPRDAGMFLLAVINGATFGASPERWNPIAEAAKKPCGKAGCKCHESKGRLMDAISFARDAMRSNKL